MSRRRRLGAMKHFVIGIPSVSRRECTVESTGEVVLRVWADPHRWYRSNLLNPRDAIYHPGLDSGTHPNTVPNHRGWNAPKPVRRSSFARDKKPIRDGSQGLRPTADPNSRPSSRNTSISAMSVRKDPATATLHFAPSLSASRGRDRWTTSTLLLPFLSLLRVNVTPRCWSTHTVPFSVFEGRSRHHS